MTPDPGAMTSLLAWIRANWWAAIIIIPLLIIAYGTVVMVQTVVPVMTSNYMVEKQELKVALHSYVVLDGALNRLLEKYHASRVGLFRFHNGSRDVYRIAYYFVSVATMVGVTVDLPSLTDLNAATYSPIFENMTKGLPWSMRTVDMKQGALRDLEVKRGNRYVVYVPIQDLEGNMAGLLGVFWLSEADVPAQKDREAMLADLKDEASRMSGYFLWSHGQLR